MHHPSSLYFGCLQHPRQLWSCPLYFWSYAPSFFLIFWLFATSTSVVVLSFIFLVVCTILLPYILVVCNIHVSCGLVLYIFGRMHHPSSLYFGCLQHPRQLWSCPLYFLIFTILGTQDHSGSWFKQNVPNHTEPQMLSLHCTMCCLYSRIP